MDVLLQEITDISCGVVTANNILLYPMRQLGIKDVSTHRFQRKKEFDILENNRIYELIVQILDIIDKDTSINPKYKYYTQVFYTRFYEFNRVISDYN